MLKSYSTEFDINAGNYLKDIGVNTPLTKEEEGYLSKQWKEKKDIIDEFRKDLTQFIIKRTRYPRMKIEIIAQHGKEKIVATTPVERFNFLQKISPSITLLKDNFKCEIKY